MDSNLTLSKIYLSCSCIKYHTQTNCSLTNMSEITFCDWYNCPIDLSNTNLIRISFNNRFNEKVDLPATLECLVLGCSFNKLIQLPKNLTVIDYAHTFIYLLPKKIRCISASISKMQKVRLPKYVCIIKLGGSISPTNWFNVVILKHVHDLELNLCSQLIVLNKKLRRFKGGFMCEMPFFFPKNMRSIQLHYSPDSTFVCPKNLLRLIIVDRWAKGPNIVLAETLEYLEVSNENSLIIDNVPNCIVGLKFKLYDEHMSMRDNIFINFPNSMGKFYFKTSHSSDYRIDTDCWSEFIKVVQEPCCLEKTTVFTELIDIDKILNDIKYLGFGIFSSMYKTNV